MEKPKKIIKLTPLDILYSYRNTNLDKLYAHKIDIMYFEGVDPKEKVGNKQVGAMGGGQPVTKDVTAEERLEELRKSHAHYTSMVATIDKLIDQES